MSRLLARLCALSLVLTSAGFAITACGGGNMSQTQETTEPLAEPVSVTINILGNSFDAESISVPVGSTVTWHNTTSADHGIISDVFDADLRPGQDFSFTFDAPGTYHVRSRTHPGASGLQCWILVQ